MKKKHKETTSSQSADALLDSSSLHTLKALPVGIVDLGNLVVVLLELADQLVRVELAVAATSLDDLGLLLEAKVLPGVVGADNLLEQGEDLVVGDGARVGEVVDSGVVVLGQENGAGEKVVEDGVAVGNVDDAVVLGDLGDKVSGVKIVADRHAKTENEDVVVAGQDLSHVRSAFTYASASVEILTGSTWPLVME
jgi:hypothetical protein